MMRAKMSRFIAAGIVVLVFLPAAYGQAPQPAAGIPDITGSWERARDASIPPPMQPPLKPQFQKEWLARTQAAREAAAKGTPLADRATMCLPEGMPAMMGASVHSGEDVILTGTGPGSERIHGSMDNTDVFRIMADALGLGAAGR